MKTARKIQTLTLALMLISSAITAQNALQFDGVNDHVTAPAPGITGASNRTVEAWVKTTWMGTQRVIVDMGAMPVGQRFTLNMINGIPRIEIGGGGINATTTINDGNWHHVAATYDNAAASKYSLYLDGVLNISGNVAQAMNTVSAPLLIGTRNDNINLWQGSIDEVRVWNYARTQSQIAADMNASYCMPPAGLRADYRFNQGQAAGNNPGITTTPDHSPLLATGTLQNFALTGSTSNWVLGTNILPGIVNGPTINATACDTYTSPGGQVLTQAGLYPDTLPSQYGCDSLITIQLTMLSSTYASMSAGACYTYTSPGGQTLTSSGSYNDTLTNAAGCDSILSIQLTIYGSSYANIPWIVCDSTLSPSGNQTWSQSGIYTDTIPSALGCDSIMTVFLTVLTGSRDTIVEQACDTYTSPGGNTYTTSGTYIDTLSNAAGCDSLLTIQLSITTIAGNTILVSGNTMTANLFANSYQWIDCGSGQPIPGTNNISFTPTQSGSFAVVVEINGCTDTSACQPITIVGLDPALPGLSIYPNPASHQITVTMEGDGQCALLDTQGRILKISPIQGSTTLALQHLPAGIYFLRISDAQNSVTSKFVRLAD